MIERSVSSTRVAVEGGGGAAFDTVTVTPADVVVLPAASRATAVSVCDPSVTVVVSQLIEYGDIVSAAPTCTPSTKNRTPTTLDVVRGVRRHRTPPNTAVAGGAS